MKYIHLFLVTSLLLEISCVAVNFLKQWYKPETDKNVIELELLYM